MQAIDHHFYYKSQADQNLKVSRPVTYLDLKDGQKWILGLASSPGGAKTATKLSLYSIVFDEGHKDDDVFKLFITFVQGRGTETIDIPRMTTKGVSGQGNVLFFKENTGKQELGISIPKGTTQILFELVNTGNVVFDAILAVKYE